MTKIRRIDLLRSKMFLDVAYTSSEDVNSVRTLDIKTRTRMFPI